MPYWALSHREAYPPIMIQPMFGPIIFDLTGTSLTPEEKELLTHPLISGVIFFTRNYESPAQITALAKQVRQLARRPILLSVDHEGGRVQRFREGFSIIPAMASLLADASNMAQATERAHACGRQLASELVRVGIDLSFTPVLDIDAGISEVMRSRTFANNPDDVITLAGALIAGLNDAGMAACGKHFPGHGSVVADSHLTLPCDPRSFAEIAAHDLKPFIHFAKAGIPALMTAHIIYPQIDDKACTFSSYWLQQVLRTQLGYQGVIFSDDLAMQGATIMGDMPTRAHEALAAGCDMVLVCNDRPGLLEVLDQLSGHPRSDSTRDHRIARLLVK